MLAKLPSQSDRSRPILVVIAVLMAAFLTAFDVRTASIGLTDLRGAFGLSFDQGSWLSTFATAPQVLVAPCVAWLVTVFGVKRVMTVPTFVYAAISITIPFVQSFEVLLLMHAARAVLLGIFVPATLMTAFRNLDSEYWIVALASYVARIPIAQNLGVYTAGSYTQTIGWHWLYWQDAFIAPMIGILLWFGVRSVEINRDLLRRADWGGMALFGVTLTMLYVALDQGNRLDWFRSGFVVSMFIASGFLALVFLSHESLAKDPWAHLSVMFSRNIALSFLAIFAFMVASLSSSFLAPNFLISVTHLRPEQIGNFSAPYAILLLVCATVGAVMLVRTIGPRLSLIAGFTCFALSSWLGTSLTSLWAIPEFEMIVVLQTVAEELTFLAAVIMILSRADPARAIALSAYIQLLRLICAEIATTTMATWIRQREQLHSYLLGLHVTNGASDLSSTLTALGSGSGTSASQLDSARRGVGLLATIVQREANVLAYIDGFWIAFSAAIVGMCTVALMARAPPHPLTQRGM
ncbi:DHA2 family multidrug resistance protein [Rhizobium sp. BK313]|uniref:MFS transporter n=1 Tax=Rhizobium sp. BK313 TaxID=2587081 RepID=UPI00105B5CCD|nr:MFS transporter [Rhizobium sp. BK313]MBB3452769.1 DHA2 family multidrug resistance protein [Rhizobium sp. BK313]